MEYINKDWMVMASFFLLIASVLVIYIAGDKPVYRKTVGVAVTAALALMVVGSRS